VYLLAVGGGDGDVLAAVPSTFRVDLDCVAVHQLPPEASEREHLLDQGVPTPGIVYVINGAPNRGVN